MTGKLRTIIHLDILDKIDSLLEKGGEKNG